MKDARTSLITALKSAIDTIGISTIATPFTLSSTSPYNIATRIGGGAIASKDSYVKVSYEVISNNTNTPYLKLSNTDYGLSNMFSSYKTISKDVGVHTYFFLVDNSVNTVITFLISATSGEMIIDNVSVEEGWADSQNLYDGLIAQGDEATGLTFYTKIPKGVVYPYIYVAEIFDIEDGPKGTFMYQYEVTLQVVYSDVTDKTAMWTAVDKIKQIIVEGVPFAITGNFEIMEVTLIDTDETIDLVDSMEVDTTIIRMNFMIQDNN